MDTVRKLSESPQFLKNPSVVIQDAHTDARGSIVPLVDEEMKSAVLIDSKKGTVRANHYHKTDWHYCYVLNGAIDYYHRPVGDKSSPKITRITQGQLFFTPPMLEHAMVFTEDTTFICLGKNSRAQEVYEEDIVRVQLYPPQTDSAQEAAKKSAEHSSHA